MLTVSCLSFLALAASAAPSVKASIVRRAVATSGETTLAVLVQPAEVSLGAYQGRLRFAPGSLSIVSVVAPSSDGTRVMNAADTAKGLIRFGGYTVSSGGFKKPDVLVLVIKPTRTLEAARLAVDIDVATDLQGKAIPANRIFPARGVSADTGRN